MPLQAISSGYQYKNVGYWESSSNQIKPYKTINKSDLVVSSERTLRFARGISGNPNAAVVNDNIAWVFFLGVAQGLAVTLNDSTGIMSLNTALNFNLDNNNNNVGGAFIYDNHIYVIDNVDYKAYAYRLNGSDRPTRASDRDIADIGSDDAIPYTAFFIGQKLYISFRTSTGNPQAPFAYPARAYNIGQQSQRLVEWYSKDVSIPTIRAFQSAPSEIDEDSSPPTNITLTWRTSGTVTRERLTDLHRNQNVPLSGNNRAVVARPLANTVYSLVATNGSFGSTTAKITVPVFKDCVINSFTVQYITNPLSPHGATVLL